MVEMQTFGASEKNIPLTDSFYFPFRFFNPSICWQSFSLMFFVIIHFNFPILINLITNIIIHYFLACIYILPNLFFIANLIL